MFQRSGDVSGTGVHVVQIHDAQVALGILHGHARAFHAKHASAFTGHGGQWQGEQTGARVQVPDHRCHSTLQLLVDLIDHMRAECNRCLTMHLPETVGINPIIEGLAVDGHLFSEQLGAITQLAIDKHGIVICSNISVATRLRYGQANLGAGLKAALPHMLALGHVQQCAGGERHGVDGHASMRTAPAHGRLAVLVGNHFDAGAPVKTVKLLITGHAIDWHGRIDMTEPAHLLGNGDGFPLELAGQ